jgi:hypothetical protein
MEQVITTHEIIFSNPVKERTLAHVVSLFSCGFDPPGRIGPALYYKKVSELAEISAGFLV